MYSNSIFVAATASPKQGDVSATATLPLPLDPDKKYEMSLIYCSFVPVWNVLDDLHMTYSGSDVEATIHLKFDDVFNSNIQNMIEAIAAKLVEEFGADMKQTRTKVKIQKTVSTTTGITYQLKLTKQSKLELSPALAELLGLPETLVNDEEKKVKAFTMKPALPRRAVNQDIYCVSCDELVENFVTRNGCTAKIVHFLHVPNVDNPKKHHHFNTTPSYHLLKDDIRLPQLHFRLLSEDGSPIVIDSPQFYVLAHLRWREF